MLVAKTLGSSSHKGHRFDFDQRARRRGPRALRGRPALSGGQGGGRGSSGYRAEHARLLRRELTDRRPDGPGAPQAPLPCRAGGDGDHLALGRLARLGGVRLLAAAPVVYGAIPRGAGGTCRSASGGGGRGFLIFFRLENGK